MGVKIKEGFLCPNREGSSPPNLRPASPLVHCSKYGVHPNQISQGKHQAKEQIAAGFAGKSKKAQQNNEARIKELHAKIGQLTVEKDFLQQAFAKI